jgi:transcriptional regulator with XRE-family HTH domain
MNFSEWLSTELKNREWSNADLARYAKISRGSITNLLTGTRSPGPDILDAIAKAFRLPTEDVYRVAGLLPVKPNADETVSEITHIYHELDEDNRQELLDYARLRLNKQEREHSGKQHPRTTPHRQST